MTWKSYLATLSGRCLTAGAGLSFLTCAYMAYRGPGDYVFGVIGVMFSFLVCVGIMSLGTNLGGRGVSASILVCIAPFLGAASFLTMYFARYWGTAGAGANAVVALLFLALAVRPPVDKAPQNQPSEA